MTDSSQHYSIHLNWQNDSDTFKYETYNRNHRIEFPGGNHLTASASPQFLGDSQFANPEQMLAAAVASCHFLTFLAIAAKAKYYVKNYQVEATAKLAKNEQGISYVSEILLKPMVTFSGTPLPTETQYQTLQQKAHKYCFIANSIRSKVIIEAKMKG